MTTLVNMQILQINGDEVEIVNLDSLRFFGELI